MVLMAVIGSISPSQQINDTEVIGDICNEICLLIKLVRVVQDVQKE